MKDNTKDGRRFPREQRVRKEQASETRNRNSKGEVEKAIEERLDDVEKQVSRIFQKIRASKQRWDASSAQEQARKWRKLNQAQRGIERSAEDEAPEDPEAEQCKVVQEQVMPAKAGAIMASVNEETGIAAENAWLQYEDMAR